MFNNPYLATPLYNPASPQQSSYGYANMLQQFMPQQPMRIPRVNGREGADAFQMPNGSEALLMDLNEPIIWLVQTDDAGIKTIDPLDVKVRKQKEPKNAKSLEERIRKLEEKLYESDFVDAEFTEES